MSNATVYERLRSFLAQNAKPLLPGLMVCAIIALAARFISDHYGAPAMLMALLFGIALHFLTEHEQSKQGIGFASKMVLRIGVALLGARISFEMIATLGWDIIALLVGLVFATIVFGVAVARLFGFRLKFGFLSAGSVAICGASAAMAISAILPRDERTEERLVFTVVGVTVLSTVAMILYPVLVEQLDMDPQLAGVFLGATIHDVAQVVGAGFSVSDETGEIATTVKLIRVALLAPVIFIAALIIRRSASDEAGQGERPPLVPFFVLGFFALVAINSAGLIPAPVQTLLAEASRWALLTAIAAVGVKTSLKDVLDVGGTAIGLLVTQTLFIAIMAFVGLLILG